MTPTRPLSPATGELSQSFVTMTEGQTRRDSFSEKTMTEDSSNGNITANKDTVEETKADSTTNAPKDDSPPEHEYPGALALTAILVAVYLAIFLVALVSNPTDY